MANPILSELYDVRRQILAEHKDDLQDYLHAELERARADGHPIAKIKQRTIDGNRAADRVGFEVNASWPPPVES